MEDAAQHNATAGGPTPTQQQAMRDIIVAQCFGELGIQVLESGILLLYLKALGLSSARVLLYLSIPWTFAAIAVLPAAFVGDRIGKKRVGNAGQVLMVLGFAVLTCAGFDKGLASILSASGIALIGAGQALMESTWFALLSPVVPESIRGRFFGQLRFSWRVVGAIFVGACGLVLSESAPLSTYQGVLGLVTLFLVIRIWFYVRIPELESSGPAAHGVPEVMLSLLRTPGFSSFCAYVFLIHMAVIGAPAIFGLIEKDILLWSAKMITWMGAMAMIGSLPGFWFGGKLVDRYTTKPVFLLCHFAYGAVYVAFLARTVIPLPLPVLLGALHFAFGFIISASTVAISTETLALIPPDNKSVSTSTVRLLNRIGGAMSGSVAAWMIGAGMLAGAWEWRGITMSPYDTILLLWALMVVVLVVTLGLVPSVIGKAQIIPRGA